MRAQLFFLCAVRQQTKMSAKTIRFQPTRLTGILAQLRLRRASGSAQSVLVSAHVDAAASDEHSLEVRIVDGKGTIVDSEKLRAVGGVSQLPLFAFRNPFMDFTVQIIGTGGDRRGSGHLTIVYPVSAETLAALGAPAARPAPPPRPSRPMPGERQLAPLSASGQEVCDVPPSNMNIAPLFFRSTQRPNRVSGVAPPLNSQSRVVPR